jgi:intein-encoded DNA endonuclease-like protein
MLGQYFILMKRLTETQRELIKKMAKDGLSLISIIKKIRLPKSVVYYWFVKEKGKKIKPIKICNDLEEEIGEIMGVFAGDGNFYLDSNYRYRIRFYLSKDEIKYAKKLNNLLKKVYGKCGNIIFYRNMLIIDIHGKAIIEHIKTFLQWEGKKTYSIRLKKDPSEYSLEFLRGFCRGVFNAEGWIFKNNLMMSSVSKTLINNISESLNLLKVPHLKTVWKSKAKKKLSYAIFFNKANTIIFLQKIGL